MEEWENGKLSQENISFFMNIIDLCIVAQIHSGQIYLLQQHD